MCPREKLDLEIHEKFMRNKILQMTIFALKLSNLRNMNQFCSITLHLSADTCDDVQVFNIYAFDTTFQLCLTLGDQIIKP